nr:hypothetical protein [Tanacetum cinerariifolium]
MIIATEQGMNVEALQVKYPIIDWEIYTKDSRKYWKIIRTRNHTEVYQFFDDMLKVFDMDDLVQLWYLVKERFSSTKPNDDKDRVLWVELKRLFKPDVDDELWKLKRYMHDPPKWRLYDTCGVLHVSIERGHDIFMLVEKDYPLKKGLTTVIVPRKNNVYDLRNVAPSGGLTCLFAKVTLDESNLWHRRLGHINFKTMNKLVRGNLVRGLLSKIFENDHTCVACQKGKQHKAYCKTKTDETSGILKAFIIGIENLIDHKVKIIRLDNGIEFKNRQMNQFCEMKGIKREFSVARTPQQNSVAVRKNRTLIEAIMTMLADSKLPTTFWAEAVNTACYVQNRVLVIKPHNKTPYELFLGRKPTLSFMRLFGCPVTILYTCDHLGKFDGKANEGFFVGYTTYSKAFRVFNTRTKIVEENLHITFLENKPNVAGIGPNWMFDIDSLTMSMNYQPVFPRNQTNGNAGTKANIDAVQAEKTFFESEVDRAVPELAARSSKRDAEEELDQGRSKRQKTGESSELAKEQEIKKLMNCHKKSYKK